MALSNDDRRRLAARGACLLAVSLAVAAVTGCDAGTARTGAGRDAARPGIVLTNSRGDSCYRPKPTSKTLECIHASIAAATRPQQPGAAPAGPAPSRTASRHAGPFPPRGARMNAETATPPSPPSSCDFNAPQFIVNPDRETTCTFVQWELFTYTISSAGLLKITGSINFQDYQWNSYSASSLSWTHGLLIQTDLEASGTLSGGVSALVASNCDSSPTCNVTSNLGPPDNQTVALKPGFFFSDGWTEKDTGGAGSTNGQVDMQQELGVTISEPGGSGFPAPWAFNDDFLSGRCDSSGTNPGCVNQSFIPTLHLSPAKSGAADAMVQFGQTFMASHWGFQGSGQPLHLLTSSSQQKTNTDINCDSSFVPDAAMNKALKPYNDTDSCTQYPFANTYENGAMTTGANGKPKPHVTTGADCAQVKAVQSGTTGNEPADWSTTVTTGNPTGAEPCVRGHIPGNLSAAVATALANFIAANRMIDKDPFWISFT